MNSNIDVSVLVRQQNHLGENWALNYFVCDKSLLQQIQAHNTVLRQDYVRALNRSLNPCANVEPFRNHPTDSYLNGDQIIVIGNDLAARFTDLNILAIKYGRTMDLYLAEFKDIESFANEIRANGYNVLMQKMTPIGQAAVEADPAYVASLVKHLYSHHHLRSFARLADICENYEYLAALATQHHLCAAMGSMSFTIYAYKFIHANPGFYRAVISTIKAHIYHLNVSPLHMPTTTGYENGRLFTIRNVTGLIAATSLTYVALKYGPDTFYTFKNLLLNQFKPIDVRSTSDLIRSLSASGLKIYDSLPMPTSPAVLDSVVTIPQESYLDYFQACRKWFLRGLGNTLGDSAKEFSGGFIKGATPNVNDVKTYIANNREIIDAVKDTAGVAKELMVAKKEIAKEAALNGREIVREVIEVKKIEVKEVTKEIIEQCFLENPELFKDIKK